MVIRQRLCPLRDEFFTLVRNEARVMCLLTHEILFFDIQPKKLHGYRIKLHEQLVLVSLVSHNTYTPNLSTSWSRTTLQGGLASRKTYLQASFPLRCFQRLSLPHIATQRCHWRDNWYTRGEFTPVLSYQEQPPSIFQRPRQIGTKLSHDVLNPAHVPL